MRSSVIRELAREREIVISKASRSWGEHRESRPSLLRKSARTDVWLQNFPPEIADAIKADCNAPCDQ
jgi:hypothetical protein